MTGSVMDLVVLVADSNAAATVKSLLLRPQALGIRSLQFDVFTHVERDPGCLLHADDFLRPFTGRYRHALVLLDCEGSGSEDRPPEETEGLITRLLARSGWNDRARAVVICPELDVWVWSDSPQVDRCLGWSGRLPDLRTWLNAEGLWPHGVPKPDQPKRALQRALREVSKPRSSSIYKDLASSVSTHRCSDPAFRRLREALHEWFKERIK